ncbi:MAG: hypothetical protein RIF32_04450 [Leptospirales bacterium]|jgi:hypothetical protein
MAHRSTNFLRVIQVLRVKSFTYYSEQRNTNNEFEQARPRHPAAKLNGKEMHSVPISFDQECPTIRVEFERIEEGTNRFHYLLIARVIGQYRDGSRGNSDARYIRGMISTAVELWRPAGVIIDFTQMKYEWGDMLEIVYDATEDTQSAYVVGPGCRRAMSTLCYGVDSTRDIIEQDGFYDSPEAAYIALKKIIRKSW